MAPRNGDQQVTWAQVGVAVVVFVALASGIWQVSSVAEETKMDIVEAEKGQEAKHKVHDDDKFAHEPMRRMLLEELEPIKEDTKNILLLIDAIEKKL